MFNTRQLNLSAHGPSDGTAALGLCATYAAGAVRCDGQSELVASEVRRGLFTAAAEAEPIVTRHVGYDVRAVAGSTPEELWLGIQQRMGETEKEIAARHASDAMVVVDGPLSGAHIRGAVGYVKTHHVHYLPPALRPVIGKMVAGQRTPLFLTTTAWSRFSWYLRLPGPADHPWASVVRCEAAADLDSAAARDLPPVPWLFKARQICDDLKRSQKMLLDKVDDALRRLNVLPVAAVGDAFDATCMRACGVSTTGAVSGVVTRIDRQGYMRDGRLLRTAEVEVEK